MEQPITDLAQVSPEWLTRVLQKQGVLPHGKVTAVLKKSQSTFTAHIVRLEARYDEGAPLSAPIHLFLKMSNPNVDAVHSSAAGQHEVAFYTTVVEAMSDPPTVRCYDAAYAPQTGHYHMLYRIPMGNRNGRYSLLSGSVKMCWNAWPNFTPFGGSIRA